MTTYLTNLPSSAPSVEFLWPKELALPGRWIDGGSTYRGLRDDPGRAA